MASWPATLPPPLAGGYSLNPVDPTIRTEMEGGNVRSRRRSTTRHDKISVVWKFTDSEMAIFRAWFDNAAEADGGSTWFTVNLATGDGGIDAVEARFSGVWSAKALSGMLAFEVSATWEIRYA